MKNKYISKKSSELLSYFNENNLLCFDMSLAKKALHGSKYGTIRELLSDMTKRGLLMRVKEGLYYVIPFEQDPDTFMPDWHLLSQYLVGTAEYYIGYYSALQIHGLTTQPNSREQIVVNKQIKPSTLLVKGILFQFIYHNKGHFFGNKKTWIDSYNKIQCSDLEKTIIDCLFKPDYSGGIVEVARAIYISKEKIKYDILLSYAKQFNSQAVIKRLGFLLELLEIKTTIIDELQKIKTASYILLDTELPKIGKYNKRWCVLQNLDTQTIISAIYT